MKSVYDGQSATELKQRILALHSGSQRQWGTMTVAQMLAHCAMSVEMGTGARNIPRSMIGRVIGGMVKKKITSDEKPMGRNAPTAPELKVHHDPELAVEQQRLVALLDAFVAAGPAGCTTHPHTFFGPMTPREWSILVYKHLDHHLRQFGA